MRLDLGSVERIGIFRALQLGDLLCSIPAIRALRVACPQAEITLIGLPWAETFVKRFDRYFNNFLHFPGYKGLPEQEFSESRYQKFVNDVRGREFDLLIQMQGNGTIVNEIIQTWNSKYVAGFSNKDSRVNNGLFMEYPTGISEIHRHLLLMRHLGIPWIDDYLEFPIQPSDEDEFAALEIHPDDGPYVCIHPGSRGRWRQWPPELFARIADVCVESGFEVAITGTRSEADITRNVIQNMKYPAVDLTGMTTLGSMGLLLRNAKLLVSNCTGVSHMAAATRTPSVVISMDGEPERWAPLNEQLHRMIDCRDDNRFDEVLRAVQNQLTLISPSTSFLASAYQHRLPCVLASDS